MLSYHVNTQIQGLLCNLIKAQTDLASQIASEVQPETSFVFKKKGNEQQFNFNRKVIKRGSAAAKALESGNVGKAKKELNEGISLLNNRQKIVKLADKSEFGWATVQEYVCDDLDDDEADALKIKKAEKRAAARLKTLQEKKKKSGTKFSFSAPLPNSASIFGGVSGSFPPAGSYFRPQGRYSGNIFRDSDLCFRCGKSGHWASSCPSKDKLFSTVSIKIMTFRFLISVNLTSPSRASKILLVFILYSRNVARKFSVLAWLQSLFLTLFRMVTKFFFGNRPYRIRIDLLLCIREVLFRERFQSC